MNRRSPSPEPARERAPSFSWREFGAASLAHLLFLAWFYRAPLLSGQVDAAHAKPPGPQALFNMGEQVYEVQPALAQTARLVRAGVFPAWTPYAQAGTPLIGKMQNGVFAPYHLPLYLLPESAIGWSFMIIEALKIYLAFAFCFLFARAVGLRLWPAVLGAHLYTASQIILPGLLLSWSGAGIALPLLLLLAERRFTGGRPMFLLFWPWAVALPFFSGHFEGAARMALVAGAYYAARLATRTDMTGREKASDLLILAGLFAAGAALAGVQIVPAWEYVSLSYNRIWHSQGGFGWQYETLSKRLGAADAPLLATGLAMLGGFALALKPSEERWNAPRRLLRLSAATLSLAAAAACLGRLGLDEAYSCLRYSVDFSLAGWAAGTALLVPALWAWRRADAGSATRVLGWILLASLAVGLKLPGLANLLIHLPVIKDFHNAAYRWEFHLALGILAAAGLQRAWELKSESRARESLLLFTTSAAVALGLLASRPLGEVLARRASTSVPPSADGRPGGFMGPERIIKHGGTYTVSLWTPFDETIEGVAVGVVNGPATLANLGSGFSADSERVRVWARMRLPESSGTQSFRLGATVSRKDGSQYSVTGPLLVQEPVGAGAAGRMLLPLAPAAASLLPLAGPWAAPVAGAALALWTANLYRSQPIPAREMPYRLGGVELMKAERGLFRVESLVPNFFKSDYQTMYGLHSLLPGGDNLDVLTLVHFSNLTSIFMADGKDARRVEQGLKLLGLANVRFIAMPPSALLEYPGLTSVHPGSDMELYRLKDAKPRAVFFDRWVRLPLEPVTDWNDPQARARFRAPYLALFDRPGFDPGQTLVLSEAPLTVAARPTANGPTRSTATLESYAPDRAVIVVDADRPGLVFLSDNLFPGWEASLDGRPVPMLRAWMTFRAVEVPAGRSRVEFRYRPAGLKLALAATVLLSLIWLPLWGRAWKARPWAGDAGPDWALASALVVPALVFWAVWAVLPRAGTW